MSAIGRISQEFRWHTLPLHLLSMEHSPNFLRAKVKFPDLKETSSLISRSILYQARQKLTLGKFSAQISLSRLNYVKDMHSSTRVFLRSKLWPKELYLRGLSSKSTHPLNIWINPNHSPCFRNFQPVGLYCSLNLGVSGLINNEV